MNNVIELDPTQSAFFSVRHDHAWKTHFAHTGIGGTEEYLWVVNHTARSLARVFREGQTPFSGADALQLQSALQDWLDEPNGASLETVIERTANEIARHAILVQHPHCIAHLHTPPLLASISAEVFIATLNQSMDSWDQASSATFVEQLMVDWLCKKYRLGEQADGIFTSGGTQSNLMGLLLARDWAVDKISQHSVQKHGLPSYAHKLRMICSEHAHFTVQKSASLLGLGEQAVVTVPCNKQGQIRTKALIKIVNELRDDGLMPFVLVGTAGTTDMGAIDNLQTLADIACAHQMWFHVDAAYGGALMLSSHADRLSGIECADSVTVDFHKLFYQSISCGAVLIKDKSHFRFLRHHADYLNREDDPLPNLVDKTIVTSKRFDALKMWITLKSVGESALGDMFDHLILQTQQVAEMVEQDPRFTLVKAPQLSTVLFRYLAVPDGENVDQFNKDLRLRALKQGLAVLGETVIDGRVTLKLTILNPCLTLFDFEQLFSQIEQVANFLREKRSV